jgi:Holliday junction resolvasome RuvABC ATP-dependent DNA helicase subunit
MLRKTKADILRLFAEAHDLAPDVEEFCKAVPANFDAFMQIVLCRIASADAPVNARETSVINLLLGQSFQIEYYRLLLENTKNIDVVNSLGVMTDIAMQLAAKEGGGDYDPQADPIVKCFESLGQAVLAADDDDVNSKELAYVSKITEMLHSNAATLDRRIKDLLSGRAEAAEALNDKDTSKPDKDAGPQTIEKCIAQLHSLVGMASVKREVETLINVAKVFTIRKQRGLPVPDVSFHMVFSGNPGTGKTSVARIVAQVYGCLGLLKGGQLIEVDRSGLVGNFVGQTATKTKKVIETAIGGVLFIDEAYALANNSDNDYGHEAIEVLLKAMEDHRDELVVIVAGYTNKMNAFLASNPGLRSRFPRVISFPDYSRDELCEIFTRTANQNKFVVSESAAAILRVGFEKLVQNKGPNFANARDVRNIFERAISMQANRIGSLTSIDEVELTAITTQDINLAVADNRTPA